MKWSKMLLIFGLSLTTINVFSQKAGKTDTTQHITLYTCPKHSDIKSEKDGYCSRCGMKLELSPKEKMKREVTRNYICPIHLDVVSDNPGKCSKCNSDLLLTPKEKMKMEAVKKYTCSMHPEEGNDKPGKCPKCNMKLVEQKKDDHSGHQH